MTVPLWSIAYGTGYLDLNPANGITVIGCHGPGMPPVRNVSTPYGLADGSLWQRHAVQDRTVTIIMDVAGASMTNLHAKRAQLIEAVSPHREQPVRLWYRRDETSTAKYLDCYYDAGLESGDLRGFTEKIGLRLLATDPYWRASTGVTNTLAVYQTIGNVNRIAQRSTAGAWSNLDQGLSATVYCATYDNTGNLYAGGDFTRGGNPAVTLYRIAKWAGAEPWGGLGAGLDNGVYALAFAPNGDVYAGGTFHTAGTLPAVGHIAYWDVAASTWGRLGTGVDNAVNALAVDNLGNLYAGGLFHTAGIIPAVGHIAMWDGSDWHTRGAAPGLNNVVRAIAVGPDNSVYAGGDFTAAGTSTAGTCNRVAVWNGTVWNSLGSGMDNSVYSLAVLPNGRLCAVGTFTTADGIAALRAALWNGASWQAMGNGFEDLVYQALSASDGNLYAAGIFGATGSRPLAGGYALWGDPLWLSGDASVTPTWYNRAIAESAGRLAIAGNFTGTLAFPGYTVVTNSGSARAYPVFTLNGSGRLYHIINHTTGERIDFNLVLLTGEAATLDLKARTFVSSFRGNIISSIISMSNWYLAPGNNYVACWIDDASATARYTFTPAYWGIDGAA